MYIEGNIRTHYSAKKKKKFIDVCGGTYTHEYAECIYFSTFLIISKPSDGKEVKDVFRRPGARVEVGSAR